MKHASIVKRFCAVFTALLLACTVLPAQEAEIRQAMKRYRDICTLEASVVRVRHNAALTEDTTLEGKLYFKAPGRMCMTFEGGEDMLLMEDGVFTIVDGGHKSVARGKTQTQFESLAEVFKDVVLGMEADDALIGCSKVTIEKEGNLCMLTVSPAGTEEAKLSRRILYTSFVLTIDLKSSEFKSLRMNERGQNYTRYDFTGFRLGASVADDVFQLPAGL